MTDEDNTPEKVALKQASIPQPQEQQPQGVDLRQVVLTVPILEMVAKMDQEWLNTWFAKRIIDGDQNVRLMNEKIIELEATVANQKESVELFKFKVDQLEKLIAQLSLANLNKDEDASRVDDADNT